MTEETNLPEGWAVMTLNDFCERDQHAIKRGPFGSSLKKEFFVSNGIKVYEQQHAIQNDFTLGRYFINEERFDELRAFEVRPGDLIVSCSGTIGRIAVVPEWAEKGVINQALLKLSLNKHIIENRFFIAQFQYKSGQIISANTRGSGMNNLAGVKELKEVPFVLPPLSEQHRIVAKIEELFSDLDAGVVALERVRTNLKRYRVTVLKAAVEGTLTEDWRAQHPDTEPASVLLDRILAERRRQWEKDQLAKFAQAGKQPPKEWRERYQEPPPADAKSERELPAGWCFASIEQVSHFAKYGSSAKTSNAIDGVPVLRMGNIQDGRLDLSDLKYLPADHEEFPDLLLKQGDLLFNRTNSAELVGKTAVYEGAPSPCSFASYLIAVRAVKGCDPRTLCYYLNSIFGRAWIASVVSQQVGQANVNGTKLQALAFPLPTEGEQAVIIQEVERRLSIVDEIEAQVEANLKRAARLRQGILKQAFEGKLVPQDPNDEPAEELLGRIRQQLRTAPPSRNGRPRQRRRSARRPASSYPLFPDNCDDGR